MSNRHCKLLIADDEKAVAQGLQGQLETLGYDVVAVVDDGRRAVDVCRRTLPDVVLMDIEMPTLDGISAAHQIADDPGTPVIILTAHSHPNLVEQAVAERVIQYLLKPATTASLHAAIQTALANSRELRDLRENVESLESTLRDRKLVERAKGILMARKALTEPEAFRFLQRQSQDRRMPMAKLAESIVQADELLGNEPPMPPPPPSPRTEPRAASGPLSAHRQSAREGRDEPI